MKILSIETSCDETALALVEARGGLRSPKFTIIDQIIASQIPIHRPFGGVVPNLAKREHIKNLPIIFEKLKNKLENINPRPYTLNPNFIAVTTGPGLEPALWAGITFAQELGKKLNIPVVGANHLEGHIYSNWLPSNLRTSQVLNIKFPSISLIVSGGHTILLLMKSLTKWKVLGETRDDAVGEAFDKVAKMLHLPYPGGPEVEKLASKIGNKKLIPFPRPMLHDKNYDFSFSGLKTAVLYYLRDHQGQTSNVKGQSSSLICASFQQAAIDVLVTKTMRAADEYKAKSVLLCGGVAANQALQREFRARIKKKKIGSKKAIHFFVPKLKYNTDNAVMIAAAAYINHLQKKSYPLEANGNLGI